MSQILPETAKKRVVDLMTTEVIKVYPDTKVSEIARLMATRDVSGIPVVDAADQVLGLVTEKDMIVRNTRLKLPNFIMILDMVISLETPRHYEERLEHILGTTAEEIMTDSVVTIKPDATIEELAELMIDRHINPIPVVEHDRLVGIISRSDIIRMMAQELSDAGEVGV
jgi:CBS domain-containing protein